MDRAECAATVIDLQRQEIERLRAALEKMDGDARWTISDLEHDLTDMRMRAEHAEAERDALRAKLATAFKDAESAAVDAVNACRQDGEADLRSVRHRVGYAIRGLKGDGDE